MTIVADAADSLADALAARLPGSSRAAPDALEPVPSILLVLPSVTARLAEIAAIARRAAEAGAKLILVGRAPRATIRRRRR